MKISIAELYQKYERKEELEGLEVTIEGYVKNSRFLGQVGFISVNDGSSFLNLQAVFDVSKFSLENAKLGASIYLEGKIHITEQAKQPFELNVTAAKVIGPVSDSYPLQKKRTTFEYLRTIPQWRMKTNTFNAVFRVRSTLAYYIHQYFHENGFYWIHTPILTANDCEGEGQTFNVYADLKKPTEFFNKDNVHLTVSGQLHVEPFALTYGKVYTFGPTFRAEKSNTTRHAAEFWMVEPEIAWAHLNDNMDLMEDFLKYVVKHTMEDCKADIEFFNERVDNHLIERLNNFLSNAFIRLPYTEALKKLKEANDNGHHFEVEDFNFGLDFGSEHEKYLTEVIYKGPVFLTDYPKDIKAFYMKQNDDNKTVGAVDLLVPFIGELCGGSERECDYDKLLKRMEELHMNIEAYQWYLDLRKNGSIPHSGFGLGFERLVMLVTGMSNIRDTLPYPRCYKDMLF